MVLDDAAVEEAVPEPAEEPWDDFVARQRAREVLQAARRVDLGVGLNGVRRVGIWDPVMQRYNIRDEE